jgi:hypothetical protein
MLSTVVRDKFRPDRLHRWSGTDVRIAPMPDISAAPHVEIAGLAEHEGTGAPTAVLSKLDGARLAS